MGRLAIIGAGGVLGAKLVELALERGDDRIYAFVHQRIPEIPAAIDGRITWAPLDLSDATSVWAALEHARPTVVINAAAMTNVDACELRRTEALAANGDGPHHLAEACVALGASLVHVSTDYVFPGDAANAGPYAEDATTGPVNWYGETKLRGEHAVSEACAGRVPWLVARTALVYGHLPGGRPNFISWLVGELRAGRRARVVSDQFNTPTLAGDLAAALLHLAREPREHEGIIHIAGPDLLSREAWARAIADYYKLDATLIDVTTTERLGQRARRPLRSGLATTRAGELDGVTLRGVRAGLATLAK